ncbi:Cleavage and polyadenylation specificity factor subunit [Nucleospora cyclopteri]
MNVIPLGAGQDVGKSCILVSIYDKTIMLDCGMHMGYSDKRKFPDFSFLSKTKNFNALIDFIIISHFHVDHCGALPYFTEVCGYNGPIYMTYPTKAALPMILEDCRKILEMKGKTEKFFTSEQINSCMSKIIPVNINETVEIAKNLFIKPYYAGHVIGAAMFYIRYKDKSMIYTGDFSTIADKHLRAATIDTLRPDLLITESTYGGILRDCRRNKERKFLQAIQDTIDRKGKVLIPIFALGRAQEICLLIENYCERIDLNVPIYLSMGLADKVNEVYKRFANYTNQTMQEKLAKKNAFEFDMIKPFNRQALISSDPCIIFASPAMLHSGNSLSIFKSICSDKKNSVILPGFCTRGTVGEKILNGIKRLEINNEIVDINLEVYNIAFSAHADTAGIMNIIDQCKPKNVMLVHGDKQRMVSLKGLIQKEFNLPVFFPQNGIMIEIPSDKHVEIKLPMKNIEEIIDLQKQEQQLNLIIDVEKDGEELIGKTIKRLIE